MRKLYFVHTFFLLVALFRFSDCVAQTTVSGNVTSGEDNTGLPGVSILEKGTTNGTVTDTDGNYAITVNEDATLVFSFVGFASQEIPVAGRTTVDLVLYPDVTALSEVVIVGYGEQERKDVTGSVTAITTKDFNKGVMTSPQDLLVGKLAGVQVTSSSGAPGSSSTIRIRGGSSLSASNDPLIVIDGFPVDNSNVPGMPNALASINPNDIASVTVLKDASATAIYGSRASNGVIIITTKKGEGKMQISYSGLASVSTPIEYVDVLDGDEFRALANQLNEQGAVGLNPKALRRLGDEDTDWQKEIYRNAFSHDHNISVAGAAGNFPYRASYGYTNQQGILKKTSMSRHTINVNLNPSFLDDHLKVNANIKTMFSHNNFGNTGAVGSAIAFDPTQPIMNGNTRFGGYFTWVNLGDTLPDGSMNPDGSPNTIGIYNPVALLNLTDNQSDVNRIIGNIQLDYRFPFLEALRVNINAGMDRSYGEGHNNAAPAAPWTFRNYSTGNGELIDYAGENRSELFDLYFNYQKDVGELGLDLTAGYSWQHFHREGWTFQRNGDASVVRLSREESQYRNENFLVSFFGRAHLSFKERYLLTATLRNDGSSRFSEENRWGLFPALALAWNVMDEPFLAGVKGLTNLKIRAGYGVTGQQDISANQYPALAIYRQSIGGASYQFGDEFVPTLRPDPYDANIKWEETTTYNLGLDLGLFSGKLNATVDVYQRETKDLINFIPIPAGSNFSNFLTTNVGNLENKGVEVTLSTTPVETPTTTWNVGVNFTRNINRITRLTKTDDPNYPGVDVGGIAGGVGNFIQNHRVGYPANSFYVFEQIYDAQGMPIEGLYVDRTGEGGTVISNNLNKYHYHSPAPDVLMGINSSLRQGKFDFSFSGRLSIGNYVYNNGNAGTTYSSVYVQSGFFGNLRSSINETRFFNPQYWSDHYVEDASFFKMDNISAGYNIDMLNETVKARLSFTVQNAFIITDYSGIDPEVSGGIDNNIYPRPRVFLVGLNLSF